MRQGPVFYDPEGKRRRVVARSGGVAGLVVAVVSTVFIISLFVSTIAHNDPKQSRAPGIIPKRPKGDIPSGIVIGAYRAQLIKLISDSRKATAAQPPTAQRIIGFYNDNDAGYVSFTRNVNSLSHFMPQWLNLKPDGAAVDMSQLDYDRNLTDIKARCRANNVKLEPILTNYDDAVKGFSRAMAHRLLSSPANMDRVVRALTIELTAQRMDGLNVDIEDIEPTDRPAYVSFLKRIKKAFVEPKLELSVDIEVQAGAAWQAKLVEPCDFGVLMAYDEHDESGTAGPIASWGFIESSLQDSLKLIPASKLVLGIGAYSLDWVEGSAGAQSESFQEALTNAADNLDEVKPSEALTFNSDSFNTFYRYEDDSVPNRPPVPHIVWMQDGVSAYNAWVLGRAMGLSGFSVWSMGDEDPSIWSFLDRESSDFPNSLDHLQKIHFPYEVDNIGKGDILTVRAQPADGFRAVKFDAKTGLISRCAYEKYASPWVIEHHGYSSKRVVLTFDDGPDPTYTPQILDILRRENVKATFFMIGEKMEENPQIVQRVYAEGHEIGSHTFFHPDLGQVSDRRITLELNATQRSLESIVGRSTIMLRPPYNADRDPANDSEVHPIRIADNLGYIIVGETADPTDWDPDREDPKTGKHRPRTAKDIVDDTVAQVKVYDQPSEHNRDAGNCILLHDAGGPRENTIAALPGIIHELRARGYTFCTVGELPSRPGKGGPWVPAGRDYLMPPIPDQDRTLILLDRIAFTTIFTFLKLLAIAFLTAISLGVGRALLITPLALAYERRQQRRVYNPEFSPPVTVVIAAYNEESVIVRTVQSVLASAYPIDEVVVVDDGSVDGTSDAIRNAFGGDARVRLFEQPNGGKAVALDHALRECRNDIMISVDADTQLPPETIGLLVRHFEDPKVGAVAGNVQVGNMKNVVTTWQGIEYTTSQNMDRRAYGLLKCITVVPGAIGSWRKSAVLEAGGHQNDTLAEDMDLTWRLQIAGWLQETESLAFAYTEAPETLKAFFRQRFRWTYGTLQCLVKHRKALFKYGFFGWFALPVIWTFQIGFQVIAPLVDLQIIISLIGFALALFANGGSQESSPLGQSIANMREAGLLYMVFFGVELLSALIAYKLEGKRPASLWWLFLQRFVYRQIMYAVIYKSLLTALRGARQGWGKLDRTASVKI